MPWLRFQHLWHCSADVPSRCLVTESVISQTVIIVVSFIGETVHGFISIVSMVISFWKQRTCLWISRVLCGVWGKTMWYHTKVTGRGFALPLLVLLMGSNHLLELRWLDEYSCNIALYTLSLGTQHLIIQCNELFDILIMRSRLLTMLFVECL